MKKYISIYCDKHHEYKKPITTGKYTKSPKCDTCRRQEQINSYWESEGYANFVDNLIDNDQITRDSFLEIVGDGCYFSRDRRFVHE